METRIRSLLFECLGIPEKCSNVISKDRASCLVSDSWLRSLQNGRAYCLNSRAYNSLADVDATLLLVPSNKKLPKQWTRVSIKVLMKRNEMVQSLIEKPLCDMYGKEWGHTESLASIACHNRCNSSTAARQQYSGATAAQQQPVIETTVKPYNEVVRESLTRLFAAEVQSLQQGPGSRVSGLVPPQATGSQIVVELPQVDDQLAHPGLQQAYGIIETQQAFFVVQTYHQHTLWETVVLAPTLLSDSYARPLFILYQILQTMKDCHQKGISVGDLRLQEVFLDNKHWVYMCQPHIPRLHLALPSADSSPTSSQQSKTLPRDASMQSIIETPDSSQAACWANIVLDDLPDLVQRWVYGTLSNFDYLMALNKLAGRRLGDPNHHPVLPWVMDFSGQTSGFRDLTKSKYRLNKGDRQLDLTYGTNSSGLELQPHLDYEMLSLEIPHHVSDILSDITYYVYNARRTPKSVLCAHVRSKWVPHEYPPSMERLQQWTPDECIPEFFTDPQIFKSIHDDLPDLELPEWASSAEDFIRQHKAVLEGPYVSARLHHWIDLTFGYQLSGNAAVKAKNVYLQLVDQHTHMENHGVVQLFSQPHPPRATLESVPSIEEEMGLLSHVAGMSGVEDQRCHDVEKKETLATDKRTKSVGSTTVSSKPVISEGPIVLPSGAEPLAPLLELEALLGFSSKVSHTLPTQPNMQNTYVSNPKPSVVARDMQAFGCLATELFLSPWLRGLGADAPLERRYSLACKVAKQHWNELPRPVRQAVSTLLQLHMTWSPDCIDQYGALFQYAHISDQGLPPPQVHHLLQPTFQLLHFPAYLPQLYSIIHRLHILARQMELVSQQAGVADKGILIRKLAKQKVSTMAKYLHKKVWHLKEEGLALVMPYVLEMCSDKRTAVFAMWTLFNPTAQALGHMKTVMHFQPPLSHLFNDEESTPKHMKLYHRSFVIQVIVRMGLQPFLRHFATLFVEAAAGYKNFSNDDDSIDRQISNEAEEFEAMNSFALECQENPFDEEALEAVENGLVQEVNAENSGDFPEVFEEDMIFGSLDELKPLDLYGSGSPTADEPGSASDKQDTDSVSSVDPADDILGKSIGGSSVHSVTRLLNGQRLGSASSTEDVTHSSTDVNDGGSASSDTEAASPNASVVPSESEEFRGNVLSAPSTVQFNIHDVAAETIVWLAHRLGPVLTAQYLSGNLLRMMALCYIGEEQLQPADAEVSHLTTTKKWVAGDINASRLLDCLGNIAVLYGEQIILLQYLNHLKQLVHPSMRRLTARTEAGLIGGVSLLTHILPFLSDATLLDILQETIFCDIFLPLLKVVSASHLSFPTGSLGRSIICYKLIDALYIISRRIGFEMTREHMTFVLQKFFAAFSRVHEEKNEVEGVCGEQVELGGQSTARKSPSSSVSSESEQLYMEIKLDRHTKEYKIGQPVSSTATGSPERQVPSPLKHSLLPPAAEEADEGVGESDQDQILEELRHTFTPELAHAAYIPFCQLAGGIHMEQNLINDDLIRRLCAAHDAALACKKNSTSSTATDGTAFSSQRPGSEGRDREEDREVVSGSFGRNVQVSGNQIVLQDDSTSSLTTEMPGGEHRKRRRSGESTIDYSKLKNPEMELNKQRHLKGNWLAYWEHEVGHSDREHTFDFKQIKLQTFIGHNSSVRSLSVLDNENSFVSASKDKTVKLWSLRNMGDGNTKLGCQWTYSKHKKSVFSVNFVDSLRLVASCDSTVHVWDPFIGMCVHQFDSTKSPPVTAVVPIPAPSTALVTATTDSTLRFLDIRTNSPTYEFRGTTTPTGVMRCGTVSPDGTWVALGYSSGVISVLDARTGMMMASWKGHDGEILEMKAYNRKSFVTSSLDTSVQLWSAEDGKSLFSFKGLTEPVHCISFYKKLLVSGSTGNRVSVHAISNTQTNLNSNKLKTDAFRGMLTAMSLLPLNRLLLLGADNGVIRLLA